jgi:hypothetical protein
MSDDHGQQSDRSSFNNMNEENFTMPNIIDDGIEHLVDTSKPVRSTMPSKWILGIFGLIIVGLFVYFFIHMKTLAKVPFPNVPGQNGENTAIANSNDTTDPEKLKTMDTDGDGLSDYEEMYLWYSSPYLADSDSDGVGDKEEIAAGSDPNCPVNMVCGPGGLAIEVPQGVTAKTPSAAELRAALLTGGFTKEQLDQVPDSELLSLYNEIIKTAPTDNSTTTGATGSAGTGTEPVTAAMIRQQLKDQGATDAELQGISDQELMDLYKKTAAEAEKTVSDSSVMP